MNLNLYRKEKHPWGINPRLIIANNRDLFTGNTVLDLGCGDGKDGLFLAKEGFNVTGVDKSETAIKTLNGTIDSYSISNFRPINQNISDFIKVNNNIWDNITSFSTLHFMNFTNALKTYDWIQEHTAKNGLNIISDFTEEGEIDKNKGYLLKRGELLNKYSDWELINYSERIVKDKLDNKQMLTTIIARKTI